MTTTRRLAAAAAAALLTSAAAPDPVGERFPLRGRPFVGPGGDRPPAPGLAGSPPPGEVQAPG
jgi:hypothetical protein